MTSGQQFELGGVDVLTHTFVLGSEATLGDKVTVEQEAVGVPGQTNAPATEAPETDAPEVEAPVEAEAVEEAPVEEASEEKTEE